MKIAIVMPLAEQRGGGELMLWHLMQQGRDKGITWLVLFLEPGPMVQQVRELGVKAYVLPAGRLRQPHRFLRAVTRIASVVRQERADAICGWMGKAHLYGSLAATLAGVPALLYELGLVSRTSRIDRLAARLPARGVITLSTEAQKRYARLRPKCPVRLVYPGLELDRFDPRRLPSPQEARRRLGLPAGGALIGIVGRLQRWKGMHVLIEAVPRVLRAHPDARCAIVGGRHDLEPDYSSSLEEQVRKLGLTERVLLAGHQTNVPEWMQAMDVVVHASDREPFGIVVIEAMALGKPVVAGADGGPTEVITHGVNGLLAPYGDAAALADAILRYLGDPAYAARVGEAARARAADFSTERYAESFIGTVRELVPGVPQGGTYVYPS